MIRRNLLSLCVIAVLVLAFGKPADNLGETHIDSALREALLTYGLVRLVNGLISVAQGTEMAISPVGLGVTLAPGEVLDPVNDLVERFASVMLVSITSLGVQKLLVEVGESEFFNLLLLVSGVCLLACLWLRGVSTKLTVAVFRAFVAVATLRFAIVLAVLASQQVYHYFMADKYEVAKTSMAESVQEFKSINGDAATKKAAEAPAPSSWGQLWSSARASLDPSDEIERFKKSANEIIEYSLDLIVIFLMQTVLLPVLFLLLLYHGLKIIFQSDCLQWGRHRTNSLC